MNDWIGNSRAALETIGSVAFMIGGVIFVVWGLWAGWQEDRR